MLESPKYQRAPCVEDVAQLEVPEVVWEKAREHIGALRKVQQTMTACQWQAAEFGWGTLMARQHRQLDVWAERLEEAFRKEDRRLEEGGESLWEGKEEAAPADSLALAAKMMTEFETLDQQAEALEGFAEETGSLAAFGVVQELGEFCRKAASLYRGHLRGINRDGYVVNAGNRE